MLRKILDRALWTILITFDSAVYSLYNLILVNKSIESFYLNKTLSYSFVCCLFPQPGDSTLYPFQMLNFIAVFCTCLLLFENRFGISNATRCTKIWHEVLMFLLSEMAICVSIFTIFDACPCVDKSVKISEFFSHVFLGIVCHPLLIYVVSLRLFANTLNHLLLIYHSILKASN